MIKSLSKKFLVGALALMPFVNTAADEYNYPEGSPVAINGKLSVKGTQMVNECGYAVQLRGMSSHGLAWFPECYVDESIKTLVNDWGIDIFRIAIYTHEWGGYTTEEWKDMDEYNEYIDELVELCAKYGIYCLIDWHVLNKGSGDPNFTLDEAVPFWDYMSKKHKDAKHVLYEICNEPNGGSVTWSVVKEYAETIIPVIRANDPNTIIICGTPTWSQDVDKAAEDPLVGDNLMYTLHFYSGTHKQYLRDKGQNALDKGLALFVTEFGTSEANGDGGPFIDECDVWMEWMKERKISWCNWSFAGISEKSAALVNGACKRGDWNNTSASGEYIKSKILEPDEFKSCENSVESVSYNDMVYVYPNPMQDELTVIAPDGAVVKSVQVMDMLSRVVAEYSGETRTINVSALSSGMYNVKIQFADGISVKRVVK